MDISDEMVRHYIDHVTVGWFDNADLPPERIELYRPDVDNMILVARKKGDFRDFRVGLELLFGDPSTDWESYACARYPFDVEESKAVLQYIRSIVNREAGAPSAAEVRETRLTPTPLREWWAARGR